MAAKLYRAIISWLDDIFQPHVIVLTMVLGVLFCIAATDAVAWYFTIK